MPLLSLVQGLESIAKGNNSADGSIQATPLLSREVEVGGLAHGVESVDVACASATQKSEGED